MAAARSRGLTDGEIALARSVFGESIDYGRVRLVLGKFWPFHPRRVTMAPMGHIHFHPQGGGWSEDFARESLGRQGHFIHEMTHVWQAQKRGRFFLPLMRHPFCRYSYSLEEGKPFDRYGLEQQAEIVRHRFLADRGAGPAACPPTDLLPF
ncbi:MAG: vgr related protein [Sphingomicrobium sp.]